jgi:hypothetical protein
MYDVLPALASARALEVRAVADDVATDLTDTQRLQRVGEPVPDRQAPPNRAENVGSPVP